MGQFKPMVKMMTTEPTVELKLAKGGAVAMKKGGSTTKAKKMAMGGDSGMTGAMMGKPRIPTGPVGGSAAPVVAPKRPSMSARRKAMAASAPMPAAPMMKKGGKVHEDEAADRAMIKKALAGKKFATGGVVNGQGGYKDGGIINTEGQGGEYRNTKMHTAKTDKSPAKTGGVKMGNAGGYATGGVAKANAGGYKKGGSAKKFADGGSVQADGRPVKMPQGAKAPSQPVSISRLSGTFKNGGKVTPAEGRLHSVHKAENAPAFKAAKSVDVDRYSKYQKAAKKMAAGGDPSHPSAAESKAYKQHYANEKAENEADREAGMAFITDPIGTMKSLPGKIREGFDALKKGMRGQGSVTTTEREVSRTVSPGKKRGGRAC